MIPPISSIVCDRSLLLPPVVGLPSPTARGGSVTVSVAWSTLRLIAGNTTAMAGLRERAPGHTDNY